MAQGKQKPFDTQQTGKIRAAWLVLTGQRMTPQQMDADWAVIQTQAAEMFNKFSSLAARLVKAEKHALTAAMQSIDDVEEETHISQNPVMLPGDDRKAALRRRAYQRRTGGQMRRRPIVNTNEDREK